MTTPPGPPSPNPPVNPFQQPPQYPQAAPAYPIGATGAYPPPPRRTSGWAIASLVFGIIGGIIVSVICGIVALNQTKDGSRGGRGMAIAGLILSGVWTLGAIAITGILVLAGGKGTTVATDVKVGDCLKEIPQSTRVLAVQTITCDQAHKGEVYAMVPMPDGDYPAQSDIDTYKNKCNPELQQYAPAAVEDNAVSIYVLYPSKETWQQGDHTVTCIASFDTTRTGSIKGS